MSSIQAFFQTLSGRHIQTDTEGWHRLQNMRTKHQQGQTRQQHIREMALGMMNTLVIPVERKRYQTNGGQQPVACHV